MKRVILEGETKKLPHMLSTINYLKRHKAILSSKVGVPAHLILSQLKLL